ncbi:hypothetical protein H2248_011500, partial [Termitomyces sp. 'cryptogamus']
MSKKKKQPGKVDASPPDAQEGKDQGVVHSQGLVALLLWQRSGAWGHSAPGDEKSGAIISTLECLEALLTNNNAQPHQQFASSTCHFCGKTGHTMVHGTCLKMEHMIQQSKICHNAEGKIILPSGAMIPNYFSKWLYMEGIKEWHRLNLGQIVTGRLSSNANPDPDQVTMQQSLIHKVMQQDVAMGQVLSKEEHIEALEHELFALRQLSEMFNGVKVPHMAYQPANNTPKVTPLISNTSVTNSPSNSALVPAAKPADKGKTPERFITNKQLPIAKEPVAQPPVHLFSSISSCYALPANRNFAAPNRFNEGTYQTMPPIYNIEQPKAVFEWVLSTKVMVSVDKLCLVSEDIRNQFRTAITPRQLVGASANTVQDT